MASSKRSKRSKARRPAARPAARPTRKNPVVVGVVAVMVIGLVLAIVLPLVVGSGGDASFDPAAAFSQRCSGCHGPTGEGGVGPQLSGGAVVRKYPNVEDQIAVVEHGRGAMPAFKGQGLSDDQIRKIVEYTRTQL